MANIKSAKKRIKIIEVKTLRNKMIKSALKTSLKKFDLAVEAKNAEEASNLFILASKSLDMAASKGVIHKNKAARKKSRMSTRLKAVTA